MHKLSVFVVNTALVTNEGHLCRGSSKTLSLEKSFLANDYRLNRFCNSKNFPATSIHYFSI